MTADWSSLDNDPNNPYGFANPNSALSQAVARQNSSSSSSSSVSSGSSSDTGNASTAPTARTSGTPDTSGFTQGSDGAMHGVMTNDQINNLKNTSWMGNQYKQDTNGYWSTNPNNINAERFFSDGRPVGTLGYSNDKTGMNFQGFTTPEQSQAIMGTIGNPTAEENLIKNWSSAGLIHPYSNPLTGNVASAFSNNPAAASSGTGTLKPSQMLPGYSYSKPAWLDQMSPEQQLQYLKTDPNTAMMELARAKSVYETAMANGNTGAAQRANTWADQVRQAANIPNNDPFFGSVGGTLQQSGQANVSVNGQSKNNAYISQNGQSYEDAQQLAHDLGLSYSVDKTGKPIIGGTTLDAYYVDANGNRQIPLRLAGNMLGLKVDYNKDSNTISIANQKSDDASQGQGQGTGTGQGTGGTGGQGGSINDWMNYANGMNVPQGQNMPIQQGFTPDWQQYYDQAHAQIDPLYNTQYNSLMGKQNTDLTKMDESMNRRGIFTSGLAEAAANDLRAKTTNSVASLFNKQMSDIEKTAQSLEQQSYKHYSDGNNFALKYNQDQFNNYMTQQKQTFTQWIGTQKLDLSQQQYALNAWDKMAQMMWKQYSFDHLSANQQNTQDWNQYKFGNLSAYQQSDVAIKQQAQQMSAYFKQQGMDIDVAKLEEAIRHNQAGEALQSAHLTVQIANNQANFSEKVRMDNANIDKANAQLQDTAKRTQLDGLKSELNSTAQRINSHVSQNQAVPQTLIDNYNSIKNNIEKIITVNGLGGLTTTTGTSDASFDSNNQF